jgi:Ca2+-binding RTX toxin-like protein
MAADVSLDNDVLTVNGTDDDEKILIDAVTIYEYDNDGDIEDSEPGVRVAVMDRYTDELLQEEFFERDRIDEIEVYGRAGEDWIANNTDIPSILDGGLADDEIYGGFADDWIYGGDDDDILAGRLGTNHLFGGAEDDRYVFGFFGAYNTLVSDTIHEDASLDEDWLDFHSFYFQGFVNVDLASTAWQTVNPTHLRLQITSSTGIESVEGSLYDDVIYGNSRDNDLEGGQGDDKLYGRTGNDELSGGDQNDLIVGAEGNDVMAGSAGNDTYFFGGTDLGLDEIVENPSLDVDTLDFSGMKYGLRIDLTKAGTRLAVDTPTFMLKLSNDLAIENVVGTHYNDTIVGNNRDNRLSGGRGNDTITGGFGADTLRGEDGVDQFWTDAADEVFGGLGLDRFDLVYEFFGRPNPRPGKFRDWGYV